MVITYKTNIKPEPHQFADLINNSSLSRPSDDYHRIQKMVENSNVMVTAWDGNKLIAAARGSSDISYYCYISDIVIDKDYMDNEIEHVLLDKIFEFVGSECSVYYISPDNNKDILIETGFELIDECYVRRRKK